MMLKTQLESGCQSGQISPKEYLGILMALMSKDKALAAHFNQVKATDPSAAAKMKLVMNRFKIVKKEVAELRSQCGL